MFFLYWAIPLVHFFVGAFKDIANQYLHYASQFKCKRSHLKVLLTFKKLTPQQKIEYFEEAGTYTYEDPRAPPRQNEAPVPEANEGNAVLSDQEHSGDEEYNEEVGDFYTT